jgi:hypothetical protein
MILQFASCFLPLRAAYGLRVFFEAFIVDVLVDGL